MKKNEPPIQAIAAVTCSQRRRIEPHSQTYGPHAPILSPFATEPGPSIAAAAPRESVFSEKAPRHVAWRPFLCDLRDPPSRRDGS